MLRNSMRLLGLILICLGLPAGAAAYAKDSAGTTSDTPKSPSLGKINVSGYRTIRWREFSSSGDSYQFQSSNGLLLSTSRLEQSMALTIHGDLEKQITVDGSFSEMPYQERTLTLNITGKNAIGRLGDFSTDFPGDQLVSFSKTIRGVDFTYRHKGLKFKTVMSKEKSKSEAVSFRGQNSRGPYNLGAFSIVDGTEIVKVDGVVVSKSDYYINYFRGDITFKYNIDSSQTVEISYETDLLLESKTGSMNAFGIDYDPQKGNLKAGVSMMSQGTSRMQGSVVIQTSLTLNITPANAGTAIPLGAVMLEKGSETVVTATGSTLVRNHDYTIDYSNGTITLPPASPVMSLSLSFGYYDSRYVSTMQNEELRGAGQAEFLLSRASVYSGKEYVEYCDNNLANCEQLIPCESEEYNSTLGCSPSASYVIFETRNSIDIINPSRLPDSNHFVRITYNFVQKSSTLPQAVDRKIYDAYVKTKLFGKLSLEGEISQTEADQAPKTIQILEEYVDSVGAAPAAGYCPTLIHKPIRGSLEIYFDDVSSVTSRKYDPVDFVYDEAFNCLSFKNTIPPGTTIIANYKYYAFPTAGAGDPVRTGNAYRGALNYAGKRLTLKSNLITKDIEFSPINDFNNMEENRMENSLAFTLNQNISIFGEYTSSDRMHQYDSPDKDKLSTRVMGATYKRGKIKEFTLSSTEKAASDNLAVSRLDNTRTVNEIKMSYDLKGNGKLLLDTQYADSDFEDNTGFLADKNGTKTHLGFTYAPADKLNLKTYFETNKIDSIAPPAYGANANFESTNRTKSLELAYMPNKIWTVSSSMLLQAKEDSRPDYPEETWDSARLNIVAKPFGRFTGVSGTYYRQDLPNEYSGRTMTDSEAMSFGYKLAELWVIE
ncbi:MAG TPA: hypothetical protein PLQ76_01425, partial [bacterium]|nr:hypothetical protein [bacterium]